MAAFWRFTAISAASLGTMERLRYVAPGVLFFSVIAIGDIPLGWLSRAGLFADEQIAPSAPRVLARIRLNRVSGAIVIPVHIARPQEGSQQTRATAAELRLLLDTGSSLSVFDATHVDKLGPRVATKIALIPGGQQELNTYRPPAVSIASLSLSTHLDEVAVSNFEAVSKDLGERIDGLLGMDFLRSCVLSVDFDAGVLTFYDKGHATFGHVVPMSWEPATLNVPMVWATVGGSIDVCCVIDTGAVYLNAGSFDEATYERLLSANVLQPTTAAKDVRTSDGITMHIVSARATLFVLGQESHTGLVFKKLRFKNCLNLGYLSRYIVTFDFPNSTMYLRPAICCDGPDTIVSTGLTLKFVKEGLRVLRVKQGSAGAAARLRADDVIVGIDGISLRNQSTFSACRRIATVGKHVVTARRGADAAEEVVTILRIE